MVNKVLILVNYNLYESKRQFAHEIAEAFKRQGIEATILDTEEGVLEAHHVASIQRQSPDFTLSFNSILPLSESRFLWDFLKIPHLSILLDPAVYDLNLTKSPYALISCVDHFDCSLLKSTGFENVLFLPHAVDRGMSYSSSSERPYEVVFLGSCYDHESLRATWKKQYSESVCEVIDDAIDIVLSDGKKHFVEALTQAWDESGLDPKDGDFLRLCFCIDNFVRGKDRYELIRSIKNAKVHVFGDLYWQNDSGLLGWPHYLSSLSNVTVHPGVNYSEALAILQKSKICLNSSPFFKNGTHERILNGLGLGCCVITSDSQFIRDEFSPEEGVRIYQHKHLDQMDGMIQEVLKEEKIRIESVAKGAKKVLQNHTWDHRVKQLLNDLPAMIGRIYAKTAHPN